VVLKLDFVGYSVVTQHSGCQMLYIVVCLSYLFQILKLCNIRLNAMLTKRVLFVVERWHGLFQCCTAIFVGFSVRTVL